MRQGFGYQGSGFIDTSANDDADDDGKRIKEFELLCRLA